MSQVSDIHDALPGKDFRELPDPAAIRRPQNPTLTLKTRRGTGYDKVPSLKRRVARGFEDLER